MRRRLYKVDDEYWEMSDDADQLPYWAHQLTTKLDRILSRQWGCLTQAAIFLLCGAISVGLLWLLNFIEFVR